MTRAPGRPHTVQVVLRLGLVTLALAFAFSPLPAALVERFYSRSAYPSWQALVTGASNRVPLSLFDLLVLLVAARVLVLLFRMAVPGKARWRHAVLNGLLRLASLAAAVYLVFLFSWGLNYRRVPLASQLDYDSARVTPDAARALAERMVAGANQLHRRGASAPGPSWEQAASELVPPFERMLASLRAGGRFTGGDAKWSLLTYYFERAGIDGMTDPFFLEVLVNQGLLPFERPAVLAHEWAHLAGYADEAEANLVGWVVCLEGPPAARYSAHLAILGQLAPEMRRADRESAFRRLDAGPRRDLKAVSDRLARASPLVRKAGWRVYDRYLKANRVEEGVGSYRSAVRLLLGARFEAGWVPVVSR